MNLEKYFDHTILSPDATKESVRKICDEAKEYNFFSVCVNPYYVAFVKDALEGTEVKVTSVIGFPLGSSTTTIKAAEARDAIKNGADEIDMVLNISALKNKAFDYVLNDIKKVKEACGDHLLKVIIETCLLDDEEKIKACQLAKDAGADYVKTSTGFSTGGATVEDVKLMRQTVGEDLGVKASGGIRNKEKAQKMIDAGATRIGASSSVKIMNEETVTSGY